MLTDLPRSETLTWDETAPIAHGQMDGVAFRLSQNGESVLVANGRDFDGSKLRSDNSWEVSCKVDESTRTARCSVNLLQLVELNQGGIEIVDGIVCVPMSSLGRSEITIDDRHTYRPPDLHECLSLEESAGAQRQMLAGQKIRVLVLFHFTTPIADLNLSPYGLKQALMMRDWIVEQYKAGNLTTAP
jgi:hypothetical protein